MQDVGKYITIYERKTGDGWRMARDIWNSSNPPPGINEMGRSPRRRDHFGDLIGKLDVLRIECPKCGW